MKHQTVLRFAAAVLLLLTVLCLLGCRKNSPARYFCYLDAPARATLTGKMGGLPFAATLYSEGRVGSAAQYMPDVALTFTSPPSLAGMTLTYRAEVDEWSLSLGELSGITDTDGLGKIAAVLLCEQGIRSSVQGQGTVTLTLLDGTVLTLDEKTGKPLGATYARDGRVIEITVVGWE